MNEIPDCGAHEPFIPEREPGSKHVYVSGRARDLDEAKAIIDAFETAGHTITFDWTCIDVIKPYLGNVEHNQPIARAMIDAAKEAEVFVLLWDENLLGALIELGAFMGKGSAHTERVAYIIGPRERFSIFDTLPQVRHCESIHEVLEELRQ